MPPPFTAGETWMRIVPHPDQWILYQSRYGESRRAPAVRDFRKGRRAASIFDMQAAFQVTIGGIIMAHVGSRRSRTHQL